MIEELVAKEIQYKTKRIPPTDKVQTPPGTGTFVHSFFNLH